MRLRTRSTLRRAQSGIAAAEFALTVLILLAAGAGLVEFGRLLWAYDALAKGTRDAARMLSAAPTAQLGTLVPQASAMVTDTAAAAGISVLHSASVTVSCAPVACTAAAGPGDVRRISVSARLDWRIGTVIPFAGSATPGSGWSVTLTPRTTMPALW